MNRRKVIHIASYSIVALVICWMTSMQTGWSAGADKTHAYKAGDRISGEAFVVDSELHRQTLMHLIEENAAAVVNVLYVFGGGALEKEDRLGGIWCPDSFEDLQILRFIHQKYEFAEVQVIPVACAPVYSSHYYGLDERVFLDETDDSEKFQAAARKFVESTNKAFADGYIPIQPFFDLRHRLLFNPSEEWAPGEGYGPVAKWQGKFRADGETQKYGVPTIWLLDSEGSVLEGPFSGNIYHSEPYEINYTITDIDAAIQKYL